MIPYKVDVPLLRRPTANFMLIGCIALAFIVQQSLSQKAIGFLILSGWNPINLISHQFLHVNITHVFGNLIFLWVFGNAVCAKFGNIKYIAAFLFYGVCAAIVHLLFDGASAVGASGAINGIVASFLVLYPLNKINLLFVGYFITFRIASIWMIIFWFIFDILGAMSSVGHVAYLAHIGGFLSGLVITLLMIKFNIIELDERGQSLIQLLRNKSKATPISTSPGSFVEEINQIVQHRLAQSSMRGRSIQICGSGDGGLEIVIDDKIYRDLKEIDNPEVFNLIQAAVTEWQSSVR